MQESGAPRKGPTIAAGVVLGMLTVTMRIPNLQRLKIK